MSDQENQSDGQNETARSLTTVINGVTTPFVPGNTHWKKADHSSRKHWQPHGRRVARYLSIPVRDLMALFADAEAMKNLPGHDAGAVQAAIKFVMGDLAHTEAVLNRIEGAPRQHVTIEEDRPEIEDGVIDPNSGDLPDAFKRWDSGLK